MARNGDRDAYPEPLSALDRTSYAYRTVQHRMPIILTQVVDHLCRHTSEVYHRKDSISGSKNGGRQETWNNQRHETEDELKGILGKLAKLRNELQTNKAITHFDMTIAAKDECMADYAEWNASFETSAARNLVNLSDSPKWFESSWLFAECYMYRRIISAVNETTHLRSLDPFKWQKAESLKDCTQNIHNMLDYLNDTLEKIPLNEDNSSDYDIVKKHFENLLRLSLWGNKGDLSHCAGREEAEEKKKSSNHIPHDEQHKMKEVLIVDDSESIWQHLTQRRNPVAGHIRVDIICDNYGLELITDLILGEFLIVSKLATQVCYHVKAMPWFVSDTTIPDFLHILDTINDHAGKFGDKWGNYLLNGKFVLKTDAFWTLPYDFDWMERKAPELYSYFQSSTLLIFKGDLNYRKLTGDLKWPHPTPFRTALRSFHPAPLCTLRGLKAEVVVGLKEGQADELARQDKEWLVSGDFAVIQFVGTDFIVKDLWPGMTFHTFKVKTDDAGNEEEEEKSQEEAAQEDQDDLEQLSEALIQSFNAAMKSGRLCLGLSESLELLDYDPKSIVVCILPYVKELNDPLKHLHLLLMEAFCKENSVRLLKVASMEGFCALLQLLRKIDPANPYEHHHQPKSTDSSSDLLIIKNGCEGLNCGREDESLKCIYDVTLVKHCSVGGGMPLVLPPVFPTYFDTV